MTRTRTRALLAVAGAALLAGGCSQPSSDYQDGKPAQKPAAAEEPAAAASPAAEAPAVGSVKAPAPYGTALPVGDFTVKVNSVNFADANKVVAEQNQFNEAPKNGQYVLVNVTMTNNGTDVASLSSLQVQFVGADALLYQQAYAVVPDSASEQPQVLTGGTVSGNVLFDVPPTATGKGTVAVADYASGGDPVIWAAP